jgi:hypothetical protein
VEVASELREDSAEKLLPHGVVNEGQFELREDSDLFLDER